MKIPKKPRKNYLYASFVALIASITACFVTYHMIYQYMGHPDIFHYYRGGGVGILASVIFGMLSVMNAYCFIKNEDFEYHTRYKLSQVIIYYGSFVILMVPVSGFVIINKIESDGYKACQSRPYSITYAKTEQACTQYKSKRHPYRKD